MAIHPGSRRNDRPATREAQILDRLLVARGIVPYALFFVSGEGEFFPNGVEEASGYVVDGTGQVYAFWTGWDAEREEVLLAELEPVTPEPSWGDDPEYRRALDVLGLSA